jgi:hypothetical protein
MFTVYDSKVGAYLQPFFMRSKGEAIRGFSQIVNDGKSAFFTNPEDYTLFELGDYFDDTGTVVMHKAPISLGVALEHVNRVSDPAPGFSRDDVN